jgi:hypothetical protein
MRLDVVSRPAAGLFASTPRIECCCSAGATRSTLDRMGTTRWRYRAGRVGASRRAAELVEETGLDPSTIVDGPVTVNRDATWNGRRMIGPEGLLLAQFRDGRPALSRSGLQADRAGNAHGARVAVPGPTCLASTAGWRRQPRLGHCSPRPNLARDLEQWAWLTAHRLIVERPLREGLVSGERGQVDRCGRPGRYDGAEAVPMPSSRAASCALRSAKGRHSSGVASTHDRPVRSSHGRWVHDLTRPPRIVNVTS